MNVWEYLLKTYVAHLLVRMHLEKKIARESAKEVFKVLFFVSAFFRALVSRRMRLGKTN